MTYLPKFLHISILMYKYICLAYISKGRDMVFFQNYIPMGMSTMQVY